MNPKRLNRNWLTTVAVVWLGPLGSDLEGCLIASAFRCRVRQAEPGDYSALLVFYVACRI